VSSSPVLVAPPTYVTVVADVALLVEAPQEVPPTGLVLTTPWRPVAGATGARVGSALLTVSPELSGTGRDAGVVAPGKDPTRAIHVHPSDARVPTRALTIPGLRSAPEGEPVRGALGDDLHVVVRQGGQPVVAVPPLPAVGYAPAQLPGGSMSGDVLVLPDLVGDLTVSVATGRSLDQLRDVDVRHDDVRLRAAPMPVGLHVVGPDGDEQLALSGPVRSTLTHDLAPALQRHLAAAVVGTGTSGGTAPVTLRSDVVGSARVMLDVRDVVVERAVPGRLTVESEGVPTSIALPGPHPGRAPVRTRADVTVTHHGAALHPASDAVPSTDADVGGVVVRDAPVVRRLAAATLAGTSLVRVAVVGWAHGETELSLTVAGRACPTTALPGASGRTAPAVVWFDVGDPLPADGPLELALRATRGAFRWYAAPDPAVRLAVAATPAGTHVTVGGVRIALTGATTHVAAVSLAGTDSWTVTTDQLCSVALSSAVLEFAP